MFHFDSCDFRCSRKDDLLRHQRRKHKCEQSVDSLHDIDPKRQRIEPPSYFPAEAESCTQAASPDKWFENIFDQECNWGISQMSQVP